MANCPRSRSGASGSSASSTTTAPPRDRRHRVVAAAGRGARRPARRADLGAWRPARGALRGRRVRELCAPEALDRGGRVVAHGAVRAGRDARAARGARAPLPVDRPSRARVLPQPAGAGAARRSTRSISRSSTAGRTSSRTRPSRPCASRPRCCSGRSSRRSSAATHSRRDRAHDASPPGHRRATPLRRRPRGARAADPRGRRAPQPHCGRGARAVRRRALCSTTSSARSPRATRAPTSATTSWSSSTRWRRKGWWSMPPRPPR